MSGNEGLLFKIFSGYHNENVSYDSTATLLSGNSTGYTTSIRNISAGTNNYFYDTTFGQGNDRYYSDNYSIFWYGYFRSDFTGTWTFRLNSDDGAYLWIGDKALSGYTVANAQVNFGGGHGWLGAGAISAGVTGTYNLQTQTHYPSTIELVEGTYYPIRIMHGESTGGDECVLTWDRNGSSYNFNGSGYFYKSDNANTTAGKYFYKNNDIGYMNSVSTKSPIIDSPTSISGLQLWLDAKDPNNNGVAPANGSTISTWYDKSGGGRNATANNAISYNTSGLSAGYPALTFSTATPRWLTGSVSITSNEATVLIVGYFDSGSGGAFRWIAFSSGNGVNDFGDARFFGFLRQAGTGVGPYRNGIYPRNDTSSFSTPYLWECWYDGTNANNTVFIGNSTTTATAASSGNFGISYYTIAANTNTGDPHYLSGAISEVIVFNRSLTTTERQQMEGYMSRKWGLQAKLPTTHPYYSSSIVPLDNYTNFPTFTTASNGFSLDKSGLGFPLVFKEFGSDISNKNLKLSTSYTITDSRSFSIPSWANAFKVLLASTKGSKGTKGGKGLNGPNGPAGAKGSKGDLGGGGYSRTCANGRASGGGPGEGGEGAMGGPGGFGGEGGDGGEGGEGGVGLITYSANSYYIPLNSTIASTINDSATNINIKNASGQSILNISANKGLAGVTGDTGQLGGVGGTGNSGNKGYPGGSGNNGSCSGTGNLGNPRGGNKGGKGGIGQPGNMGGKGGKTGKGGKGGIGDSGQRSTNTLVYDTTKLNDLTFGNNNYTTAQAGEKKIEVYFFAT